MTPAAREELLTKLFREEKTNAIVYLLDEIDKRDLEIKRITLGALKVIVNENLDHKESLSLAIRNARIGLLYQDRIPQEMRQLIAAWLNCIEDSIVGLLAVGCVGPEGVATGDNGKMPVAQSSM